MTMEIPKRTLGRTGVEVTALGLGGEGVLRTFGFEREAYTLINRAIRPLLRRFCMRCEVTFRLCRSNAPGYPGPAPFPRR
jgi:hypothetical protein